MLGIKMKAVNITWHSKLPSMLLIIFKIISCYLLFLLVSTLHDGQRTLARSSDRETDGFDLARKYYGVCTGDLLDKRHLRFEKEEDGNYRFTYDQSGPCRLVRYTTARIVSCLDLLHYASQLESNVNYRSPLHFVFMGDSRVRHQYYNFAKLIPDYDQGRQPMQLTSSFHGDIEITSNILRLRLSFKWRPLIDDSVVETIRGWTASNANERPHLVFLGMVVHHMITENGANYQLYEENLLKLASELTQLANVTQLIWFNQHPVLDSFHHNYDSNKNVNSLKIHNYNKAIRRILKNKSNNIRVWDSSNSLAEEYVRSCGVLRRDEIVHVDNRPYLFKDSSFTDCNDYIHTGYSALSQATNLLYNDICNSVMEFLIPA